MNEKKLKELMKSGKKITPIVTFVNQKGTVRDIVFLMSYKNKIINIGYLLEQIGDFKQSKRNCEAITIGGCGMDMAYHIVYVVCVRLFGKKGHKISSICY